MKISENNFGILKTIYDIYGNFKKQSYENNQINHYFSYPLSRNVDNFLGHYLCFVRGSNITDNCFFHLIGDYLDIGNKEQFVQRVGKRQRKSSVMVRKNYKETSASCLNCEVLDICLLKNDILSEEIEVADFAKEGCVKYKGEGEQRLFLPTEDVLRSIVKKPIYKSELRENFALNEKRLKLTFEELGMVFKEDSEKWTLVSKKKRGNYRNHEGVPIIMCNKYGEKIRRFPRIKDAVEYLKLDKGTSIQQSLRQGCMAYGYLWIRESEYGNR